MAESSQLSFPPSATVPSTENAEDWLDISRTHPLIDLYNPPGIPLKPNLVSFSKMNPCASNCCQKWTTLVHLLVSWVSFLQVTPAKKSICFDMQMAAQCPCCIGNGVADNGFSIVMSLVPHQLSRRASYEIFEISMERSWALERQC